MFCHFFGEIRWRTVRQGGGEMITMTSGEAASHFFANVHRTISPEAPDVSKLVEIAKQHQLTFAAPPG